MKRDLRYMLLLPLAAFALMSCDPIEEDQRLIESFDHTAPAYVMFVQSMKGICAASGGVVSALNFNEWLTAPTEESRLEVEDKYFTYRKIREQEENLWNIYDRSSNETYFLYEGLTLGEEGAQWELRHNPTFFYATEGNSAPTITRLAEDRFGVAFDEVPVNVEKQPYESIFSYLNSWGYTVRANLTAELSVATNNEEFRAGEAPLLQFIITGGGVLLDKTNNYRVEFEITEPLRASFADSGLIASNKACVGALRITNSLGEWLDVTLTLYNTIVIDYHPKDSTPIRGYYNWNGDSITPR